MTFHSEFIPSAGPLDIALDPDILALALKKKKTSAEVVCPFCGEAEELYVDLGGGENQTYTEDCAVCCRPRIVHVSPGDFAGDVSVWLERDE